MVNGYGAEALSGSGMNAGAWLEFVKMTNSPLKLAAVASRMPTPTRHVGISRVDKHSTRTHAWVVRLQRNNRKVARTFSDGVWGGKAEAYQAACEFYRQMADIVPALPFAAYCDRLKSSNRSGIPGVSRHLVKMPSGRRIPYWYARCPLGLHKTKLAKFSVKKHGEVNAFQLAVKARQDALGMLEGDIFLPKRPLRAR